MSRNRPSSRRCGTSGDLHFLDLDLVAGQPLQVGASAFAEAEGLLECEFPAAVAAARPAGDPAISSRAPWAAVPSLQRSKQNRIESGRIIACRPISSTTRVTLDSPACSATIATISWAIPSSCIG